VTTIIRRLGNELFSAMFDAMRMSFLPSVLHTFPRFAQRLYTGSSLVTLICCLHNGHSP
jgi:hypothetical protein